MLMNFVFGGIGFLLGTLMGFILAGLARGDATEMQGVRNATYLSDKC